MTNVQKSFIREILKVTVDPQIISFAGGLPNPQTFPVEEIETAASKVLKNDGKNTLQYSTTEGYLPLRQYIVDRYKLKKGLDISPDDILITNGSQQALDLIGKAFVDKDDDVIIESPGYLGAIQALSMYEPNFHVVPLNDDGIDIETFRGQISKFNPKIFYSVPNFQNPTGITYSSQKRVELANVLSNSKTIMIEDDPYGELRFLGENLPSMKSYLSNNIILLGSFSKIISPGMRLGWVCANQEVMEKLIIAKQASDLHSNFLSQRIIYQYLVDCDLDDHIERIKQLYKAQRNFMISGIDEYFPKDFRTTRPEGGMFLWVEMPDSISSIKLFDIASKEKVVFVPGDPFYINITDSNAMRLNYTNSTEEDIEIGIKRLVNALKKY